MGSVSEQLVNSLIENITELKTNHKELWEYLHKELTEIKVEIAMLKVKSSVWGFLAGAIPAATVLIILMIKNII